MRLYLAQHGKSTDEKEDPERPLTPKGVRETETIGRLVAGSGLVKVKKILHSAKLRARQTAEIFASFLAPPEGTREIEGISPMDEPSVLAGFIESEKDDLMIVGHLPHLSKTVSILVVGDENEQIAIFRNSGVISLEKQADGSWAIVPLFAFGSEI